MSTRYIQTSFDSILGIIIKSGNTQLEATPIFPQKKQVSTNLTPTVSKIAA
jgi:hypothetical protein